MDNRAEASSGQIIQVTDKALGQILKIKNSDDGASGRPLRVGVIGGGCSGLSYKIEFGEPKENDHILTFNDGIQIVIDPKSAIYLKGVTLNFSDGLEGKGFVFENPNAKNTCGCGESFSV